MISGRMNRPSRVLAIMGSLAAVAAMITGCGTQRIKVPKSDPALYRGALLFSERCAGCHTLSYAATHGSASNIRSAEITNGPDLDQRCERPVTRVLYAIENGGFSGAIMPQNVVVGQDAIDVAQFVSKYAGTHASVSLGQAPCHSQPIGTLPALTATATTATTSTSPAKKAAKTSVAAHAAKKAKAKAKAHKKR